MKTLRAALLSAALLSSTMTAALTTATGLAHAETTWNFANAYAATELHSEGFDLFAAKVDEKTKGELKIALHHGGSLFPNPEILQATRDGLVEVGTQIMTNLGRENALWALDGVPFFVTSYDEAQTLWAQSRGRLSELLAQSGLRLLFAAPWPSQGFFMNREVKTLADVKGMKMRAYNPSTTRLAELMGATPQTVQMTEAPQAFATGLIDSLNTSPTSAVVYSIWEYSNFYIKTDYALPKQMVFVREESFQSVSPEVQKAILDSAAEAEAFLWDKSAKIVKEAEDTLAAKGMTITIPEGQLATELDTVGEAMITEWMSSADDQAKAVAESMKK